MIATSGFLTALECTKFVFGRGPARAPRWGSLHRSPRPSSCFKSDPTFKRKGRGEEWKGGEGTGEGTAPITQIAGSAPDSGVIM